MKDQLCRAFCGDLVVREVPDGFAVSTGFRRRDGDAVAFFIIPVGDGLFRIEDDGTTMPFLMEAGVDFGTATRARALGTLLEEYGAVYDEDEGSIRTDPLPEAALPRAAMRFVALLLRMSDFLLLTQERVISTFQEDAAKRIREALGGKASILENEAVAPDLGEVIPDMVLKAANRHPVALFFGNSMQRVYDAIILQMAANYEAHIPVSVIALLESDSVISQELRRRAANRLAAVPVYRHDEVAAIHRIAHEAVGLPVH